MVKTILLVKKKPGLSREEFIRHYEDVHARLALKYLPTLRKYIRNFIIGHQGHPFSTPQEPEFDAIVEFWWDSREDEQAANDWLKTKDAQALIEDEESFMDRNKFIIFGVDERVSKI